jgi:GT2 family glycosyltransferase
MSISVIVSNFNGLKFLPRLIETLRQQQNVTTEIIIVDRESKDGSLEYLAQFPDISVLSKPAAAGLVSGYAVGAAVARLEHLFFCNEDMWFDPMCLHLLELQISLEHRIGAVDPWQWTYDRKTLIHGGTRFYKCKWEPNSPFPVRGFDFAVPLQTGDKVPFPCAGAFLIHRRVYEEIGGWDTSFFLDHEDIDLFVRAWQRGWNCVTVPDAKVYHAVNTSNTKALESGGRVLPRRYISNRSNLAVIAFKYYSGAPLLLALGNLIGPVMADLVKRRWNKMSLDLQAVALTVRRMGAVRRFRCGNREWAKARPGFRFFLQEDMTAQYSE